MNEEMKRLMEIDIDTIEEKPLTDIQKQRILKSARTKKAPKGTWRRFITAAIVGLAVISGSLYALPTIASQVPFVENILEKINPDFVPKNYLDLATIINQVESSNGVDMMIENAVYDGTTLMVSYAIKSDKDLGTQPFLNTVLNLKGSTGGSSITSIDKIDDGLYAGMIIVIPMFDKDRDNLQITWQPKEIINQDTNETFEGDWTFSFKLDELPVTSQHIALTSVNDPVQIKINRVDFTELSTTMHYEYNIDASIMKNYPLSSINFVEAVDNFGNKHEIHGSGGVMTDDGHGYNWSFSFYNLPEDVTSLTVSSEMHYVLLSGNEVHDMREQLKPITIELDR